MMLARFGVEKRFDSLPFRILAVGTSNKSAESKYSLAHMGSLASNSKGTFNLTYLIKIFLLRLYSCQVNKRRRMDSHNSGVKMKPKAKE